MLDNTAEIPKMVEPRREIGDEFLNQNPLSLQGLYDRERLLAGRLLYVELANLTERIVNKGQVDISIAPQPGFFELEPFADPSVEGIRREGFDRLNEVGKYRHDSNVIRTTDVKTTADGVELTIQRARYSSQAQSNLILDYRPKDGTKTLRMALLEEAPGRLPALSDERLVNSLGVTIQIYYRDDNGQLAPFLVPRTKGTAVFNQKLWHDSASGAAEWPDNPQETQSTFEAYILDDLYQELWSELDLQPEDLQVLLPLAVCREIVRAGKPQVFFFGYTRLSRSALIAKMEIARKRAKKKAAEPDEIYRMPLLRKSPATGRIERIEHEYERRGLDPQCAASFYYCSRFLRQIKNRVDDL